MEATYQKEQGGGTLVSECHGEHHLPDYAGDMKKILSTAAHVLPAGKFVGGEEVQFGGAVCYDIWYLDAEDRLTHEAFTTDYEFSCPRSGETADGTARVSIQQFMLRPSGPRRISAKATLQATVCLRETARYTCESEAGEATLHTRQKTIAVGERIFSAPLEREYGESIALPTAYANGAEIIFSQAYVHIENVTAEENAVLVRGNYAVAVILAMDGHAPLHICESFSLEERIPLEGCDAQMDAMANGYFVSLTCGIRNEAEAPAVTLHGIVELSADAQRNLPISVATDAFLEGGGGSCEMEPLVYDTFGPSEMLCRTVELRFPLSEDACAVDGVFHTTVTLKNETREAAERAIAYTAEAEICALCYALDADGGVHYSAQKQTVPLHLDLPLHTTLLPDGKIYMDAAVGMCEGRLDENEICACLNLLFAVSNRAERTEDCVRRIVAVEQESGVFVPTYTVYYPTAQDSLWSIAKRYATSPAAIAACNHLSAETSGTNVPLPGMLLIDKRKK